MYYQLVEIKTGEQIDQSLVCNKWFKRTLSRLNRKAWEVEGKLRYAIACYIPDRVYVFQRWENEDGSLGDIHRSKWINISELSQEQRQVFLAWYGDNYAANCEVIPASVLSFSFSGF